MPRLCRREFYNHAMQDLDMCKRESGHRGSCGFKDCYKS